MHGAARALIGARVLLCASVVVALACDDPAAAPLRAPPPAEVFGGAPPEALTLSLVTSAGPIRCRIEPRRTPRAAALVVGLARGGHAWRHPRTGAVSRAPLYADLPFARTIPGVMIQTGCVVGDATGHPGYRIPVEASDDDATELARGGSLLLARYTPPPGREDPSPPPPGHVLGSQLAVALTAMPHLAGRVTRLGRCEDLDVVRTIAAQPRESRARLLRIE